MPGRFAWPQSMQCCMRSKLPLSAAYGGRARSRADRVRLDTGLSEPAPARASKTAGAKGKGEIVGRNVAGRAARADRRRERPPRSGVARGAGPGPPGGRRATQVREPVVERVDVVGFLGGELGGEPA